MIRCRYVWYDNRGQRHRCRQTFPAHTWEIEHDHTCICGAVVKDWSVRAESKA
jgi:hypothetical protein